MQIVSFDFDGTLTRTKVQEFALQLILSNVDVWIVTSRYDDLHKHLYPKNITNDDLWYIIDNLNLPRYKVIFRNMLSKSQYLEHTSVIWHLEDDDIEIDDINKWTKTKAIDVKSPDWKTKCLKLLI